MYIDEFLDYLKCGKKIRRASWPMDDFISRNFRRNFRRNFHSINIKYLLANDWEVIVPNIYHDWWIPIE